MATLREYFDSDFDYTLRVQFKLPTYGEAVIGTLLLDFSSLNAFVTCYVPGEHHKPDFFLGLLPHLAAAKQVHFDERMQLPAARYFVGQLRVANSERAEIEARLSGDPDWAQLSDLQGSRRVYIYSPSRLDDHELGSLKIAGKQHQKDVVFRSVSYSEERSKGEKPLAFICHDSRDKDAVARKIALGLQRLLCPVWYDEFSLQVGDNLRETIERGLKICQKCILVLSPNFVTNTGWTKKEFDSVFTREILERKRLLLPVWFNVSQQLVFEYSPSLLNVKGLDWTGLGDDEVCRQLFNVIVKAS